MEEPQPNPLKFGLWSLEVNWGEGGLKDRKDPLTSSKMNSQQWIYLLQFLFVCLSFIKLNRPKLSFQQEKFGNIINSRHVAFPVKMAGIHHTKETDVFHVHSGWCRDNIPSIPPCRSLHFEFFPHNQRQFFTLTLRLSKSFCQTRCFCLFLLFFWGTGDSYGRCLQLAWLPVPQGGAVEMLGHLPFLCSQHLSRAWSLEHWHPMTLPMFPVGSARKLQQKRCRSKGTDNEKQGGESFGGFKGTKTMPTWLGASQLQTCRLISTRLLNNCSTTTTTFKLKKKNQNNQNKPFWAAGFFREGCHASQEKFLAALCIRLCRSTWGWEKAWMWIKTIPLNSYVVWSHLDSSIRV